MAQVRPGDAYNVGVEAVGAGAVVVKVPLHLVRQQLIIYFPVVLWGNWTGQAGIAGHKRAGLGNWVVGGAHLGLRPW